MIILLVCFLLAAGLMTVQYLRGKWQSAPGVPAAETDDPDVLRYNGGRYIKNDAIETVLLMGLDKYADQAANSLDGQQADMLLLLILDRNSGTCTPLHINRDTMCTIYQLDAMGEPFMPLNGQICLAHAYGSGGRDSCRNQVRAVSELLYDAPINHYASVTMDAVGIINNLVGGVTVMVLDDLSALDSALVQGETVTLQGDQALTYVRARMGLADPTNLNRMKRQQQYLTALQQKFTQELAENDDLSRQIITAVSDDMVSDFTVNSMSSFVDMATTYTFTPIREIAGEAVYSEDRSPEFYADEDALYQTVVELFYLPLDAE
jgi:LCP family protein required for cell wall assembly